MKTKLQKLLIAIAGLLVSANALAYDFKVDGICYNIISSEDRTVKVIYQDKNGPDYAPISSYNYSYKYQGDISIPSKVIYNSITYSVTSIEEFAFANCEDLTSITIHNSVTSIGRYAFYECTSLTSVTIPNSVTSIGLNAFIHCSNLTEVNISDIKAWYNIDFSGWYSNPLYYANKLYLNDTKITDLVIPNSVTNIKDYAFYNCNDLASVTIPNSVTRIGNDAFYGCELTKVKISDIKAWCNIDFLSPYSNPVSYNLYLNDTKITDLVIPNSVTSITSYAFNRCTGLTSVTIPNSVIGIGVSAFEDCTGLTDVNISDLSAWCKINFHSFSSNPLYNGAALKLNGITVADLIIPNDITIIKSNAFRGYSSLTSVTIPNSVTSIGESAFSGCN